MDAFLASGLLDVDPSDRLGLVGVLLQALFNGEQPRLAVFCEELHTTLVPLAANLTAIVFQASGTN